MQILFKSLTDYIMNLEKEAKATKKDFNNRRSTQSSKYSKVGTNRESRPMSSVLKNDLHSVVDLSGAKESNHSSQLNDQNGK